MSTPEGIDFRHLLGRHFSVPHEPLTPPELHYPVSRSALAQGLHVLTEKPLALNLPDALDLVHLARERGLLLAVMHNRVADPDFLAFAETVRSRGRAPFAVTADTLVTLPGPGFRACWRRALLVCRLPPVHGSGAGERPEWHSALVAVLVAFTPVQRRSGPGKQATPTQVRTFTAASGRPDEHLESVVGNRSRVRISYPPSAAGPDRTAVRAIVASTPAAALTLASVAPITLRSCRQGRRIRRAAGRALRIVDEFLVGERLYSAQAGVERPKSLIDLLFGNLGLERWGDNEYGHTRAARLDAELLAQTLPVLIQTPR
ncbi:Gfo/Idh/MocA family oxidoreductase [Kitasatospora sp. NPDC005751]|uniref:Gfo/Idh/MocA family protein n=1 Tax=Kitasatospora sp. NPDC005751 TaxID=3157064 RepID=UPI0033E9D5F5